MEDCPTLSRDEALFSFLTWKKKIMAKPVFPGYVYV